MEKEYSKKSYVNQMNDLNRKMKDTPIPDIYQVYSGMFNHKVCELRLYYQDVWFGTSWIVSYSFVDGFLATPFGKCVGGAYKYTNFENNFPKLNHHKVYEYYREAMKRFDSQVRNE